VLKLKQLRSNAGLSIQKLADLCGVSRRTIEDIETRGDCRISTAYTICKALGCSLDDFYTEVEE
jgi:putative transcriptional regulator